MKFAFQEWPRDPSDPFPERRTELRPFIPITVINKKTGATITVDALVDSGASSSLFPGLLGLGIGIDVEKGPGQFITGIGNAVIRAHFHKVYVFSRFWTLGPDLS